MALSFQKTFPTDTFRLFVISHSAVVAGYQDRFSEVARQAEVEITLLVPRKWQQFNRWIEVGKISDPNYRIIVRQPICWGLQSHRLRNVTHIYPELKKLLKEVQPEIIELWEEPFSAVTAHTIWIARRVCPEVKIIFFSARNILKKYFPPFCWFEQYTYKHADFAFLMNEETKEIIRKKGWRKGSIILPMGVDPDKFRKLDASHLRQELGLSKFTVGFVGKFNRQKGVLELIRACAALKGEINLLLVGRGPLLNQVQQLVRELGIGNDAIILNPVSHQELPFYLNCLDVLVLPSVTLPDLKEQFGRVLIEAMACEVPVIGSSSGEIPRVIGDAGLIFPEGDIDALAARINLLMKEPSKAIELARGGGQRVEENYSWAVIARKQVKVYHQLLEDR